jgi:hypothetical protein
MGYDIRQEILKELKRRNWSIYRFAKELDGKVNIRVVYQYLSEGQDTGTEWASKMLKTLGLTIIRKSNVQVGKRPRKEARND